MISFIKRPLKNLSIKIGSGATPTGGDASYKTHGISLIRSQNILDYFFSKDGLAFIDEKQAKELNNVTLQENDVLVNITGDSVARVCQVPLNILPARVNQHVAILRANPEKLAPAYLKYYLLANPTKERLLSLASTGATRKALTKAMLEEFEIDIPDEEGTATQTRIASILSALDDKIALNRRTNHTLEQMAQTLFKKYFVDDIDPNNSVECSLLDFAKLLSGGTPKTDNPAFWDGGIKWVSAKDVTPNDGRFILNTEKTISKLGLENSSAKLLPQYSTIITARGTVGKICLLSEEMAISQSNYGLKAINGSYDFVLFQLVNFSINDLKSRSYGTVFDTITTQTLRELRIISPEHRQIQELSQKLTHPYEMILSNLSENLYLASIRDTLLPKLMSGEIEIP